METTEIYRNQKSREKKLWVVNGVLLGVVLILALVIAGLVVELREKEPRVIAYTSTGIPKFVEQHGSYVREIVEVQSFVKHVITETFTLNYADFLEKKPLQVFLDKGVHIYYDPSFLREMVNSMIASGFISKLISARAVIFVEVLLPIEVKYERGYIWARARVKRLEKTAQGETHKLLDYYLQIALAKRTLENPWGLKVVRLVVSEAKTVKGA